MNARQKSTHLTPPTAIDYLHGVLGKVQNPELSEHVEACQECQDLLASVRRATAPATPEEIQRIVNRMKNRRR